MKYPGSFILNEYGTNKELAKVYGVSERTVYRWKAKAKAETGARSKKPTHPRISTLQNFKGTRKQLAKKYGISERTAYRWLAQAKEKGADIPSRQKSSSYPGPQILTENLKNKELATKYNVSERTISRWKKRAAGEIEEPFEVFPPDSETQGFDIPSAEDFEEPFEVEDINMPGYDDAELYNLVEISDILTDPENPIINNDSFADLSPDKKLQFIDAYLRYQYYAVNKNQFYDKTIHEMVYDPENPELTYPSYIANMDIWGEDFNDWLEWQLSAEQIDI